MFRFIALLVIALLVAAGAWLGQPNHDRLAEHLTRTTLERVAADLKKAKAPSDPPVRVAIDAGDDIPAAVISDTKDTDKIDWLHADAAPGRIDHTLHLLRLESSPHSVTLRYVLDGESEQVRSITWYVVLPPLLAIVTAIIFRRVILSLALGVATGGVITLLLADRSPLLGIWHAFEHYLIRHALLDTWRIEITAFVILISATVALARHSGGIQGLVDVVIRYCRTPRSARIGTAIAGLFIFFDDYLNCIIVGNTLRPLTDRYRVSRAKLAYIVDSTAAPLAGLAVFSVWIAFEITQIEEGLMAARLDLEPFAVFVQALPTRFYCIFTLFMVFALAWTGRDFGPMLEAERRATSASASKEDTDVVESLPGKQHRARYAIVPLGLTFLGMIVGLWWSGWEGAGRPSLTAVGFAEYVRAILGRTNSMWAFSRASALGLAVAVLLIAAARVMPPGRIARTCVSSTRIILKPIVILFLAWALGGACKDVGTAAYLVALFQEVVNPVGFGIVVFLLSCLIAFATGSSYSTMAILLPNIVPLAFEVGDASALTGIGLATIAVGAVLDGAIFGDHCSPISDTTILSALSSQCDTIEHVRTQMPYALTGMAVALIVGYIPATLSVPPYLSWCVGALAVLAAIRLLGKRIDQTAHA